MATVQSTGIDPTSADFAEVERIPAGRYVRDPARMHAFVVSYAENANASEAARKAGVDRGTVTRWLREERVIFAIHQERQRRLVAEYATIGMRALVEIVTERLTNPDGTPGPYVAPVGERRQAARELVRLGGHSEALTNQLLTGQAAAALHELTEDELARHIAEAQRTLVGLQAAAPPDAPRIAPDAAPKPSLL